jgi:hypothetical protein
MDSRKYSVVINIDKILIDQAITSGLSVTLSSEGRTVTNSIPLDAGIEFELRYTSSNIRVSFGYSDVEIASGYLALPIDAKYNSQFSYQDTLVTQVKNISVENSKFVSNFSIEVNNSHPRAWPQTAEEIERERQHATFKDTAKSGLSGSSPLKSTFRGSGKKPPQGETSPLKERVHPVHPRKADKVYKFQEEELHGYLKRVVDHHI